MNIEDLFKKYKNVDIIDKQYIKEGIETSVIVKTNKNNKYVLKIHDTDIYDSPKGFLAGARLMEIINEKSSIPVADVKYLNYNNGKPFYITNFVEGYHYSVGNNYIFRKKLIKNLGKYLAFLHNIECKETYGWLSYDKNKLDVFSKYEFFDELIFEQINNFITNIENQNFKYDFKNCLDKIYKIKNYFKNNIQIKTNYAYCHLDYKYENIIIKKTYKPVQAIIDWDAPMIGDPLYNIMSAERNLIHRYHNESSKQKSDELINIFRKEYNKYSKNKINFKEKNILFYKFVILLRCMKSFKLWFKKHSSDEKIKSKKYYENKLDNIYSMIP